MGSTAVGIKTDHYVVLAGQKRTFELIESADKVFKISPNIGNIDTEQYTDKLSKLLNEIKPQIILLASNRIGKELAPRLASKFNTGSATECISADIDENRNLKIERIVYSGNGVADQTFAKKPQFATLASQTFKPLPRDDGRTGEIVEKTIDDVSMNVKIVNISERSAGAVCIEDAEFIVSVGRGIKNKEDNQKKN